MKNYKQIAEDASKELNELRSKKAVLEAKIKEQAEMLGLDLNQPLNVQVEAKLIELNKLFTQKEQELDVAIKALEDYKAEGDATGDFE